MDIKTRERVDVDEDYIAWVREEITTYYADYLKNGLDYDIHVAVGIPAREILRRAREVEPDLILLGGSTEEEHDGVYKKPWPAPPCRKWLGPPDARCWW